MKMDIVACTDNRFVMPTGVMIQSVCVNNPDVDIVFHIIVDDSVTTDVNYVASLLRKWKIKKPLNSIYLELPNLES